MEDEQSHLQFVVFVVFVGKAFSKVTEIEVSL